MPSGGGVWHSPGAGGRCHRRRRSDESVRQTWLRSRVLGGHGHQHGPGAHCRQACDHGRSQRHADPQKELGARDRTSAVGGAEPEPP